MARFRNCYLLEVLTHVTALPRPTVKAKKDSSPPKTVLFFKLLTLTGTGRKGFSRGKMVQILFSRTCHRTVALCNTDGINILVF